LSKPKLPSAAGGGQRYALGLQTLLAGLSFLLALSGGAEEKSPADWVNPLIDTHKSRWFFFSSACRPFGMVNLSPDMVEFKLDPTAQGTGCYFV